jgi:hypothetical protein
MVPVNIRIFEVRTAPVGRLLAAIGTGSVEVRIPM